MVVEASYLFPFLILLIVVMMLLGFFRHDSIVLKSAARRSLIRRLQEKTEGEERFGEKRDFPMHYLSVSDLSENLSKKEGSISGQLHYKIMPWVIGLDKSLTDGRFEVKYKAYHAADHARKMRAFLGKDKEKEEKKTGE